MSTSISFNKKLHGKGHMVAYAKVMEQSDLSDEAIKEFARALKQADLDSIKKLFGNLSKQQTLGLIRLYIDYNDIENTQDLNQPRGFILDLAKKFEHNDILEYLTARANEIDPNMNSRRGFAKGSSAGFFAHRTTTAANPVSTEKTSKISDNKFVLTHNPALKKKPATLDVEKQKIETTTAIQRR